MKRVHYNEAGEVIGFTSRFEGDVDPLGSNCFEVDDDVHVEIGMDADPATKTVKPNKARQQAIKARIEKAKAVESVSKEELLDRLATLEAKLADAEAKAG